MHDAAAGLVARFRERAARCRSERAPLYGALLDAVAGDVAGRGVTWSLLAGRAGEPPGSGLELRLMSAVHRLVLEGRAPGLGSFYASVTGEPAAGDPWAAFRDVLVEHLAELDRLLDEPLQTNEVGRSAALLGGYLRVAQATGLPLRVLEPGASGGLNLCFDRYRYVTAAGAWGPPASPVRFVDAMRGPVPLHVDAVVASRRGCDLRPLDVTAPADRARLLSYCWPEHRARFDRLRAAIAVVAQDPPPVDRADAIEWLRVRLRVPHDGVATVVAHSLLFQYLSDRQHDDLVALVEQAGGAASRSAPLAWLRLEPDRDRHFPGPVIALTLFDGARSDVVCGTASPLGVPVEWF